MTSIRRTLLLWLSAGLTAGILAATALLYLQAREEANQIFDYQLRQVAAALPSQFLGAAGPGRLGRLLTKENIVIQIWDRTGLRMYYSDEIVDLPQRAILGFSNVVTEGGVWRVYSEQQQYAVVQIAQPLRARSELAAKSAIKTALPLLLLIPFLGLLVWVAVTRSLSPVRRVAAEVKSRDAATLSPVSDAGLPEEIQPLTHALNDLLKRLDSAIDAQRSFVADAAHELRTPLTALKLQVQLAERAQDDNERRLAFGDLRMGLERAHRLVQQLLTLARQEPAEQTRAFRPVDLSGLARSVIADFTLPAQSKRIDLGLSAAAPVSVAGDEEALRILLNNLIDNAIRYTPEGGRIDVSVITTEEGIFLVVEDNGPGIDPADLGRVFDRFYRGADARANGSGLGLAIVRRIADIHGAVVGLSNTGNGLRAQVIFGQTTPVISTP